MEKTIKSSDERSLGYGPAYVINGGNPDHLVGRILTIIEALGLPQRQEDSLKDILRQEVYNVLSLKLWIPGQLHTMIREFGQWYAESGSGANTPETAERIGFMGGEFELSYKE